MSFSGLKRFPLGERVPSGEHAVCVSLPTMADVVGYETKDPAVMEKVRTGYPRFVVHHLVARMNERLLREAGVTDRAGVALPSERAAAELAEFLDADVQLHHSDDCVLAHFSEDPDLRARAKAFLQHTGLSVSSRHAEDFLHSRGLLDSLDEETMDDAADAPARVRREIAEALGPGVSPEDVLLATSGANAFHALFRASQKRLAAQGKTIWIQLGWLYVDTIRVLEKFTEGPCETIAFREVNDLSRLRDLFDRRGDEIAAVVTETPTNPLVQTCDLDELRDLCRARGAMLVADPTIASPRNVKVADHVDVIVNSLTKYAANAGDVMLGCLAFPETSRFRGEFMEAVRREIEPPYPRDLARLAREIGAYPELVKRMNENVLRLAAFLESHPKVKKLHWAYSEPFRANYENLAGAGKPGCMLSFELKEPVERFYDKIEILKSPSFGTTFSLLCPYVYLAHYDLIQDEAGLTTLAEAGLAPELVRVSLGAEPAEEILAAFEEALG